MNFFSKVKKNANAWKDRWDKERAERKVYQNDLKKKIIAAKREAYAAEAIKQARIKSVENAKLRYNPPKQKQSNDMDWLMKL